MGEPALLGAGSCRCVMVGCGFGVRGTTSNARMAASSPLLRVENERILESSARFTVLACGNHVEARDCTRSPAVEWGTQTPQHLAVPAVLEAHSSFGGSLQQLIESAPDQGYLLYSGFLKQRSTQRVGMRMPGV